MSASKGFFCEPCNIDCKNKSGLSKHRQSQAHRKVLAAAKAEKNDAVDSKGKGQVQDEGGSTDTYCKVCNLECKTAKALATHIKSKSHKIRAAEKNDDNEEEKQEDCNDETYCDVCKVECKTPGALLTHTNAMSHILKASKSGAIETVDDRGDTFCRTCHVECNTADGLSAHKESMGHLKRARKQESFFCKLCNIDCFSRDGVAMHEQTRAHRFALANSQYKDEEEYDTEMDASEQEETYCDVCNIDCKTSQAFFSHCKSMTHILKASQSGTMETVQEKREDPNSRRNEGIDGFFCTLCNVDCFNDEGVAMHCQTRYHAMNRANAEMEGEEEEEEDMDKDEEEVTYCVVCQVECKTPGGFFSHTKSMSHIIRASESGAMETVQDRQSDEMEDDEDKGPLYCRACKRMCKNEQEFCEHTQTIGHRMKQRKYDQQQQMKFADNRGPGQWGDNYGPGRWGDNRGPGQWGDNRGPGRWGDNRGPGRWAGGPPDHERQPPPQADVFYQGQTYYWPYRRNAEQPTIEGFQHRYRGEEQADEPQPHPDHPEILVDAHGEGVSHCTFCNSRVRTADIDNHQQVPRHRRRVRAINAGGSIYAHTAGLDTRILTGPAEIQKEVDESKHWLVGIEYIYEIHRRTTIGKPYYLCTLCDVGHIEVVPHVTCKDHRQIYFKKHCEELEDIVWPHIPRPGTEFHSWYMSSYMRQVDNPAKRSKPKPSQETTMLARMAMAVNKERGKGLVNKHQEVRGKLVRPEGPKEKGLYPNAKPMQKWSAKRIFIGNLPYDVNEMELLDFLNRQTINRAIIDLEIGKDKKFAFVTFRTYEDASQFLVFDGILFKNLELRVTRPHNYEPLPGQDDDKVLRDCTIPRAALLHNQVLPYPVGSKHTNSLHIKSLPTRVEPDIIVGFLNSLVLGTPATGVNEIQLKHRENWAGFATFRSTEETTDVLEAALGELFQFKPIMIARPTNYVSPEEAMAVKEMNKPIPQMPPGAKRPCIDMPLYTNFQKISRLEPTLLDGFRGGSMGFVKPGDRRPQHQYPDQYDMEGQGQYQGQDWGRNQGQHQSQGRGPMGGQNQGRSEYHEQGQMRGQGQSHGQHQGLGYGEFQGQGRNQGQGRIQNHGQSQSQYEGQGQRQRPNQFQGQSQNQHQGAGQNPGQDQFQGRDQYQGQGSRPPVPSQGIKGTATYVGQPGQRRGPPPPDVPSGPPPPPRSADYPPPPQTGPPQYGNVQYSMTQPPPPQLPPPPKETQLTRMLKESKDVLTNDTICTDEEATMAQQVAMQLSGGLNVYNSMKGVKQAPYVTTVEAPQDADLEEWLKYMSVFLDKGRIVLEEEEKLAQEVVNILTEEVKKYQDRCTVSTTDIPQFQAATPSTAPTAASAAPVTYTYPNYAAYGQYNQYATSTNMSYY